MSALLTLAHIDKFYGATHALRGINLEVQSGEVVVLLGPSGCGKSTLLRCINGLEPIQGGTIALFNHLSVIDNILLGPLKAQKRARAEVEAQADRLLQRIGLYERKNAWPRELSGGQKQRIAIVRALCLNPNLLLLDEITAALDPEMVREVLDVVLELAADGMTMLIVTHEMGFARKVADRILFMDHGEIIEESAPESFFTAPASARAQAFLNLMHYQEYT